MPADVELPEVNFKRTQLYWADRFAKRNTAYVTLNPNELRLQAVRVESMIRQRFKANDYYKDGIDFGCGAGRFAPLLCSFVGHLWGFDTINGPLELMRAVDKTVSAALLTYPIKLPLASESIDFFTAIFTLQHITNEQLLTETAAEVRRVLRPGARVLILDNAVDFHAHLRNRNPNKLAELFELRKGFHFQRVTLNNKPNDHWLIDGFRA